MRKVKTIKMRANASKAVEVAAKLVLRGRRADSAGNPAQAYEEFRRALAADPACLEAHSGAAWSLLELGRVSDAAEFIEQRAQKARQKAWVTELLLGELRMAQFKPSEAEKHFRKACKLKGKSTVPAVFLARCLRSQEKFSDAKRVLLKALGGQGDLEEVYLNLGLVMRATADYRAARAFLVEALRIDDRYTDAKIVLADVRECIKLDGRSIGKRK